MRLLIFQVALFALGCGTANVPMNSDSKSDSFAGGACEYYPTEPVELEFKEAVVDGKRYKVTFLVKEHSGNEFKDYASLNKECKERFEQKGTIPGVVKRIKTGVCSPISVSPENFDFNCWR